VRAVCNSELLDLWEKGSAAHPLDQGLFALGLAFPEISPDELADWSLGRRNRGLFELYRSWFGTVLHGWTSCTSCGEKLELEVDVRTLTAHDAPDESSAEKVVADKGSFRLPTSRDLAQVVHEESFQIAAIRLLERCRISGGDTPPWSEQMVEEVGEKMAHADPLAETQLALRCPTCGHEWTATLDVTRFIWAEIEAYVRRIFWEIHTFASAYGWTEAEVLSLSGARRALYLEMVQG